MPTSTPKQAAFANAVLGALAVLGGDRRSASGSNNSPGDERHGRFQVT
jgi:hypothetical protein